MEYEYKFFLEDLFESISRIKKYTAQINHNNFKKDQIILDAIARNLGVMEEAIRNIPSEIKKKYPKISWSKIAGFKKKAIPHYWIIDTDILRDIIQLKIPQLEIDIVEIIKKEKLTIQK